MFRNLFLSLFLLFFVSTSGAAVSHEKVNDLEKNIFDCIIRLNIEAISHDKEQVNGPFLIKDFSKVALNNEIKLNSFNNGKSIVLYGSTFNIKQDGERILVFWDSPYPGILSVVSVVPKTRGNIAYFEKQSINSNFIKLMCGNVHKEGKVVYTSQCMTNDGMVYGYEEEYIGRYNNDENFIMPEPMKSILREAVRLSFVISDEGKKACTKKQFDNCWVWFLDNNENRGGPNNAKDKAKFEERLKELNLN